MEHTTTRIERIVVGIDLSERAEVAFTQALNISRKTGAALFLAHAVATAEARSPDGAAAAGESADADADRGSHVPAVLEEMCRRGRDAGVETYQRVIESEPDEGVPRIAAELGADLVVVGTHGRSGLRGFLLGGVAERMTRLSRTRVLVARPRTSARGGYNHILLPTDFSPCADEALAAAVEVVSAGGVIEVVHFWHMPRVAASYWVPRDIAASRRRILRDEIDALGEELTARFERRHQKISFENEEKPPTTGLLERIQSEMYDLVVVGSHGHRGIRRWVSGGLAASTLRRAPCSVLVIHPGAE